MSEQLSQQQRDDFIDESRRIALETLQIPEVQQRLGGYANELFALSRSVVSAPLDNPDRVGPRELPATVLRAGEKAVRLFSEDPFDDYQLNTMSRTLSQDEITSITHKYKKARRGKTTPFYVFDQELGLTHTQDVSNVHGRKVLGRPMTTFNYDRSNRLHVDAPLWYHESYHAKQARDLPVQMEADFDAIHMSWELEAYRITAMTILGIQDAGTQHELLSSTPALSIERTLEIEDIRAHGNKYETNPYAASEKVASDLVSHGYGITPFLSDRIARR